MKYTYRKWNKQDIYDFYIEFNRIEEYNEYCKSWLKYFNINVDFQSKTDWKMTDIVDINDFNRVKSNINLIMETIESSTLPLEISEQSNQVFNDIKATEIDNRLKEYLKQLGEWQFTYNMCGLTTTGNSLKLGGVN